MPALDSLRRLQRQGESSASVFRQLDPVTPQKSMQENAEIRIDLQDCAASTTLPIDWSVSHFVVRYRVHKQKPADPPGLASVGIKRALTERK